MQSILGVEIATLTGNLRYIGRDDICVFRFNKESQFAGVFTQNFFAAAPIKICRELLSQHQRAKQNINYWLINAGQANAATGTNGLIDAQKMAEQLSQQDSNIAAKVLPFSTGVIGERIPVDAFGKILTQLKFSDKNWQKASHAIMTTDTKAKTISINFKLTPKGETLSLNGIVKGSGMIAPNMATLLAFLATDAKISADLLQKALHKATQNTFNCLSIDSDCSTNDALVIAATQKKGGEILANSPEFNQFCKALNNVCKDLVLQLAHDGEGATKVIKAAVKNAESRQQAQKVAESVINSPLVKTALFAEDANLGRIVMAVGKSLMMTEDKGGLQADKIKIYLQNQLFFENEQVILNLYDQKLKALLNNNIINIAIDLSQGTHCLEMLGNDLSHDYIKINAEYRS